METILLSHYQSPVGEILVGSFGGKICLCDWANSPKRTSTDKRIKKKLNSEFVIGTSEVIDRAIQELEEYFGGRRKEFDLPLLFTGTDFQNSVWAELLNIPFGSTISYAEQAQRLNKPNAVRAVASANANNPISILVPCHRVIGSNHKLTGYAGGLEAKQKLLELELNRF